MRMSILAATLLLFGCDGGAPAGDSETADTSPLFLDGLTAWRERNPAPSDVRDQEVPITPIPGQNWMNCDGFLTNNRSAGFCEPMPPASWTPFMFDGKPYFFVPLSG